MLMLGAAGYLQTEWIVADFSLLFLSFSQNLQEIIILETCSPLWNLSKLSKLLKTYYKGTNIQRLAYKYISTCITTYISM